MVKEVLEKLNAILDEPGESCLIFVQDALVAIEGGYHKDGFEKFQRAVEKAVQGKYD